MPRHLRLTLPGVATHIVQRGNNRAPCFFGEEDRGLYLRHLLLAASELGCALHAYCLMTNHVHLLVTPESKDGCSRLMKRVGQAQTQYVNRAYRRSGTLWDGRFKSCLVQSDGYVLNCYRYIELNPVRAGMVAHPSDFVWSSHRANASGTTGSVLKAHPDYLALGGSDAERRRSYAVMFGSHIDPEFIDAIRNATNGGFALGGRGFRDDASRRLRRRVERSAPGRPALADPGRDPTDDLFAGVQKTWSDPA